MKALGTDGFAAEGLVWIHNKGDIVYGIRIGVLLHSRRCTKGNFLRPVQMNRWRICIRHRIVSGIQSFLYMEDVFSLYRLSGRQPILYCMT